MEGKQIRTYAESHKYTSPKNDIPTRIYYKAKSSFKHKKILPVVGEQLGVSGVEWKKTPNLCTVCG